MIDAKCEVRRLDALIPSRNPKKKKRHPAKNDSATLPQVINCYVPAYCTAPTTKFCPLLSYCCPIKYQTVSVSISYLNCQKTQNTKRNINLSLFLHSSYKLLCQSQHKFILYFIIFCHIKRTKLLSRILPSHISYFLSHVTIKMMVVILATTQFFREFVLCVS